MSEEELEQRTNNNIDNDSKESVELSKEMQEELSNGKEKNEND